MYKFNTFLALVVTTIICLSPSLFASEPEDNANRPKIGLVLSGGGARGAAHVGVLKILEENNIPIDMISGTSMGSVVGGLYASGMSPAEIEIALTTMDWDKALTDEQSRQYLSLNQKRQQDLFTTILNPGFNDGRVQLPSGAILGQNIDLAIQRLTAHVSHITDFDNLRIPFRAVATDIAKGDAIVLDSGSLAIAMRASMAVPSVFSPVHLDGRILVDGGLTDNLPVKVARNMGADIVIVIDISTPLLEEEEIDSLISITDQLTRLLTAQNTRTSRESLYSGDILIIPDLGNITASQFHRSNEAIAIGELEAQTHLRSLSQLSLTPTQYQDYLSRRKVIPTYNQTIRQVTLNNQSHLGDEILQKRITIQAEDQFNIASTENDIGQIYGLGVFEKVGYNLSHQPDGIDVEIYAAPKSWGPNYLHFGFDINTDFNGDSDANLVIGYSKSEINSLGGEWTSLLQIGATPNFQSYFHQPLGVNLNYFIEPSIYTGSENTGIYNSNDDQLERTRIHQTDVSLAVGREFGTSANLSLGITRLAGDTETIIGSSFSPATDFDDGGVFLNFRYDTLDNIHFPTSGSTINTTYYSAVENIGAQQEYEQWEINAIKAFTFNRHTIVLALNSGGALNGTASLPKLFTLGGFFNMSGLRKNQESGQFLGLVKAAYYRRFNQIKLLPAYIGVTAEYGGVWQNKDEISSDSTTFAGSLFLGLDSPAGPLLFGLGITENGDSAVYAKIGRLF